MSIFGDKSFFADFWKRVKANAVYRGKVREVLMSREAANINFNAFGINIRGTIFPDVAADISGDKPTRYVMVGEDLGAGVAASYNTQTNVLKVKPDPVNSRYWKGLVIHEAVHAWIDRSKLRPLVVDNEAVAYIAQAVYYRRVGMGRSRFTSDIYLAARDVANVIINGQGPSEKLLSKLKTAILTNSVYSHISATLVDTVNDG
jgi:hypothetical protein